MQVEAKYMLLAKDLMTFERDTTQHWMQHAHASAEALLRQPVLLEDPHTHRSITDPASLLGIIRHRLTLTIASTPIGWDPLQIQATVLHHLSHQIAS